MHGGVVAGHRRDGTRRITLLLLLMRLMLGVGESVAFPSCSKILARHVPERSIGADNGAVSAGMKLGRAVGTLGGGLLMQRYGWRPVFIGIGILSLLWWLPAVEEMDASRRRICNGRSDGGCRQ